MKKVYLLFFAAVIMTPQARADEAFDALSARVAQERKKEQDLQALAFEVDRLKLELEKKKALVELGRLSQASDGADAGHVLTANGAPVIALRYVLLRDDHKEAVFDVDGREQRVLEGEWVAGKVLKSVSADGIRLQDKEGKEDFMASGE